MRWSASFSRTTSPAWDCSGSLASSAGACCRAWRYSMAFNVTSPSWGATFSAQNSLLSGTFGLLAKKQCVEIERAARCQIQTVDAIIKSAHGRQIENVLASFEGRDSLGFAQQI